MTYVARYAMNEVPSVFRLGIWVVSRIVKFVPCRRDGLFYFFMEFIPCFTTIIYEGEKDEREFRTD